MAWFLNLWNEDGSKTTCSLIDRVNVEELQQQLSDAGPGAVIRIPARMADQIRESPLFIRPDKWAAWQFFHHDSEVIE